MTNLRVGPNDLIFFADETGDEKFSDPNHPLFGMGGCALYGDQIDYLIVQPWRALKAEHFGSADVQLHASALRELTNEQMKAFGAFFRQQRFFRFATVFTKTTKYIGEFHALDALASTFHQRAVQIIEKGPRLPTRVVFMHESSERGDKILNQHFGKLGFAINNREIPIVHGLINKHDGGPALEVADFVMHAVGAQVKREMKGESQNARKDFAAVFRDCDPNLLSYLKVESVEKMPKTLRQKRNEQLLHRRVRSTKKLQKGKNFRFK